MLDVYNNVKGGLMAVTIATFNVENLFARYKFKSDIDASKVMRDGWLIEESCFDIFDQVKRSITAAAIKAMKADILCLQEVEGMDTVKKFRTDYLGGRSAYPYIMLVDGNDPRLIDVAVLSKFPIVHARSHQHFYDKARRRYVFSRDNLEVDVMINDKTSLTLYVNHLKSMVGGRRATAGIRTLQCERIKASVMERFGKTCGKKNVVILGDFNDYPESDAQGDTSLGELLTWKQFENCITRLAQEERWTHHYAQKNEYKQLDYILLSKTLASKVISVNVERRGLPLRASAVAAKRFKGVGDSLPKASDHCPFSVTLDL